MVLSYIISLLCPDLLFHRYLANSFGNNFQILDANVDDGGSAGRVDVVLSSGAALHQLLVGTKEKA